MGSSQQEEREEIEIRQNSGRYLGFLLVEDITVHFVASEADE